MFRNRALQKKELEWADLIARTAHEGQVDKSGEPYIGHPRRVAAMVEGHEVKVVALLHDVLEDSPPAAAAYFLTLMKLNFSWKVVGAITTLTHLKNEPNVEYWARVKANPLALTVKLADIADNTDFDRMAKLDYETRERLREKYRKALEFLNG